MSVKNLESDFFSALQKHSNIKLTIMREYLVPWMRKIVLDRWNHNNKCLIIDGFAGAGLYQSDQQVGSPIIILKEALNFYDQCVSNNWEKPQIYILLIENNKTNYEQLKSNIFEFTGLDIPNDKDYYPIPGKSIYVKCLNNNFKEAMNDLLNNIESNETLIPSFCFIDPFGFSHTPFSLISRYLQNQKAEIFLNFIFEETNRFIKLQSEKIEVHISELFGVENLEQLREKIGDKSGQLRKEVVVDYYSSQLLKNSPIEHVLNFEIKKKGKTKLILFYGTKSKNGLKLMKDVMWDVDDTGSYMFDDNSLTDEIQFTFFKDFEKEEHISHLSSKVFEEFRGKDHITKEDIEDFVLLKTIYPIKNYLIPSLKLLENEDKIAEVVKINGQRRNKGSFKDVLIKFNN
ncbi:three-Cys-motif partner protein TcmP [Anaerobacillus sp. MEB173]|uniref:three-Cys-motif partner protein TcmP n=1 Tax=Anaerobacillus sp. MEB173 TaxID=3383345 RepID=UPI003F8FAC30